jgi:DNA-binding NarL/FixJ family response regulator
MKKIKLLVACSSTLARMGVMDLIAADRAFEIVGETFSLKDTISAAKRVEPDIILLCFHLLLANGPNSVAGIMKEIPGARVVAFNTNFTMDREWGLVQEGVRGIFNSNCPLRALVKGLKKVYQGGHSLRKELIHSLIDCQFDPAREKVLDGHKVPLSIKEINIFSMATAGIRNRAISTNLGIAESTVKGHLRKIYKRLHLEDRLQATLYAIKHGIPAAGKPQSKDRGTNASR